MKHSFQRTNHNRIRKPWVKWNWYTVRRIIKNFRLKEIRRKARSRRIRQKSIRWTKIKKRVKPNSKRRIRNQMLGSTGAQKLKLSHRNQARRKKCLDWVNKEQVNMSKRLPLIRSSLALDQQLWVFCSTAWEVEDFTISSDPRIKAMATTTDWPSSMRVFLSEEVDSDSMASTPIQAQLAFWSAWLGPARRRTSRNLKTLLE